MDAQTADQSPIGAGAGVVDPSLSLNITTISDFSTQSPFIDLMKTARSFTAPIEGGGSLRPRDLVEAGVLDENGYPTEIPDGARSVRTIWDWGHAGNPAAEARKGVYVLEYEGEGKINLGLHARVLSEEPGRIVFENPTGAKFSMEIRRTDPDGTGDYIRDVSIVRKDHLELHEAGAIFNPEWLSLIEDARQLRFMDWARTNHSINSEWDERATFDDATWATLKGAPLEVMVRLANETGADAWFNIPHGATDDYVREYAAYVKEHLDPELVATFEFSNELWNPAFSQGGAVALEQVADLGEYRRIDAFSKRATEVAVIVDETFGDDADARVQNVLATQSNNPWITGRLLDNPTWRGADPDGFVEPGSVFDAVGVTTYFGGSIAGDASFRDRLSDAIDNPRVNAFDWLRDQILNDEDLGGSIPYKNNQYQAHLNYIAGRDLDLPLVAYEGGQHILHSFAIANRDGSLDDFFAAFIRSEQAAELYQASWDSWAEYGSGPYSQFGDVSVASRWGAWGLREHLDDETPRAALLDRLNAEDGAWWDDDRGDGDQFRQGVTLYGEGAADLLTGTLQEDYLIGRAGDDSLRGGAGDDGLHGGDGFDTAVFSGSIGDYSIAWVGGGYVVDGVDGVDRIVEIERLVFDDGEAVLNGEGGIEADAPAKPVAGRRDDDQDGEQDGDQDDGPDADQDGDQDGDQDADQGGDPDGEDQSEGDDQPDNDQAGEDQAVDDQSAGGDESDPGDANADNQGSGDGADGGPLTFAIDLAGQVDGSVSISALREGTALARDIGFRNGDATYAIIEERSIANIDGHGDVQSNYFVVHENRETRLGPKLGDSALATTLSFGDVAENTTGVRGSGFADKFNGWTADDLFHGGGGADSISTRMGDDTVIGGAGSDMITTGSGADLVIFGEGDGRDRILDFSANDTLDLTGIDTSGMTVYEHQTRDDRIVLDFGGGDRIELVDVEIEEVSGLNILF